MAQERTVIKQVSAPGLVRRLTQGRGQPGERGEVGATVPTRARGQRGAGWGRGHRRTWPHLGHVEDEDCVLWVSLLQPQPRTESLTHRGAVKSAALTVAKQSHSHSAPHFIVVD